MKRAFYFFLIGAVIFVFFSQCASLKELVSPPSVSVDNVSIQDITYQNATVDFELLVRNPNAFGVSFDGFDYTLDIEGEEFLSGREQRGIQIEPVAQSTFHVPLTLNFQELYQFAQRIKNLDTLSYHFTGQIMPGGVFSGTSIPFRKSGAIPNVRIPSVALGKLEVQKMGLSGIDLQLNLKLNNPNSFSINVGKMDYSIALAGQQVAEGARVNVTTISAKSKTNIQLPLSINVSGLGSSLLSVLRGESVKCSIESQTALESPFGELMLPINMTENIHILR